MANQVPDTTIADNLLKTSTDNFIRKYKTLSEDVKESLFYGYENYSINHMFYYGVGSVYQLRHPVLPLSNLKTTCQYIINTFGLKDFQICIIPNLITLTVTNYLDNRDAILAYLKANCYILLKETSIQISDGRYASTLLFTTKPHKARHIKRRAPFNE